MLVTVMATHPLTSAPDQPTRKTQNTRAICSKTRRVGRGQHPRHRQNQVWPRPRTQCYKQTTLGDASSVSARSGLFAGNVRHARVHRYAGRRRYLCTQAWSRHKAAKLEAVHVQIVSLLRDVGHSCSPEEDVRHVRVPKIPWGWANNGAGPMCVKTTTAAAASSMIVGEGGGIAGECAVQSIGDAPSSQAGGTTDAQPWSTRHLLPNTGSQDGVHDAIDVLCRVGLAPNLGPVLPMLVGHTKIPGLVTGSNAQRWAAVEPELAAGMCSWSEPRRWHRLQHDLHKRLGRYVISTGVFLRPW